MAISYRAKRHHEGAEGFAVFDGGSYLGDVTPIHRAGPGFERKRPTDKPSEIAGWSALPAGHPRPLEIDADGGIFMPGEGQLVGAVALWPDRKDAAAALRDFGLEPG